MDGTEAKPTKKKRGLRMNIHAALNNFASSASMHGIPRIINANSVPARVFWSIVFVGAFLTFIWTGINLLNQYYSYPKKVNVEIIQRPVTFPSVTVCNTDHFDILAVNRLEKVLAASNGSEGTDDFEGKYLDYYSTSMSMLVSSQSETGAAGESMKDSLEFLSRLGFVANVGVNLSSNVGIKVEDFIVNCRFMDEDCNITKTFRTVFDPYYFNCFTFEPQRILQSEKTRLSGVEYGLSLLLFVGCAGQIEKTEGSNESLPTIPGMTESDPALVTGQGARVVVHSPRTRPLPTADGFDVPTGYSISIGLRARENFRIGLPHGNCTPTREGKAGVDDEDDEGTQSDGEYTYTLISCQNKCIQNMIIKTCQCVDNRIPTLSSDGINEGALPFCLQLPALPDFCKLSDGSEEDFDFTDNCDRIQQRNMLQYNKRLDCRKQVYENMTIRNPDAMDSCGCHPPCRDVVYETTNSLSMLPDTRKGHAFYHIVDTFVERMSPERKKALKRKHGLKYRDYVKSQTARVNIHIADSNIIKTTESPDYDLIRLVSDIGGQLGLWIGISVITLIEVLQLCADIFGIIVSNGRRLKSDWKRELPKGKQQSTSPSKGMLQDGGGGGGGGGEVLQAPVHHHHHPHHHPLRYQHPHLHKPLSRESTVEDDAPFEIDKMTSV